MCSDHGGSGDATGGLRSIFKRRRAAASQLTTGARKAADPAASPASTRSSQQGAYLTTRRELAEEELHRLDDSKLRLEHCIALLTGLTGAEKRARTIRNLTADLLDAQVDCFPQDRQGKLSEEVGTICGHIRAIRTALASEGLQTLDRTGQAQEPLTETYRETFRKAGEELSGAARRIAEAKNEGTQMCLGDIGRSINAIAQTVPELYPLAEKWTDTTLKELHDALGRIRWGLGLDRNQLREAAGAHSQTEITPKRKARMSRTKNVGPI